MSYSILPTIRVAASELHIIFSMSDGRWILSASLAKVSLFSLISSRFLLSPSPSTCLSSPLESCGIPRDSSTFDVPGPTTSASSQSAIVVPYSRRRRAARQVRSLISQRGGKRSRRDRTKVPSRSLIRPSKRGGKMRIFARQLLAKVK